ncbi:DUF3265 domain-containing protein [Vibrio parahaemolyticus]|nr:DUF3265 domain-containing protein [Vibrio parahaemolyticus]
MGKKLFKSSSTNSQLHNKRFKADSQRVAFVVCSKFSDVGGLQKHSIALLTT